MKLGTIHEKPAVKYVFSWILVMTALTPAGLTGLRGTGVRSQMISREEAQEAGGGEAFKLNRGANEALFPA